MAKNNQKHTKRLVQDFLNKTGFPFEMKMAKILEEKKWDVETGQVFLDLEENKKREIDIIAQKDINDISVNLIAECKFSEIDSWIFVSPIAKVSRYYSYVKRLPKVPYKQLDTFKKCVDHLSILDYKEPLGKNFIAFNGDKKSNNVPIFDALNKVIKATLYWGGQTHSAQKRSLYFHLVLFSGPIFTTRYVKHALSVEKTNYVQYPFEYDSEPYKKDWHFDILRNHEVGVFFDPIKEMKERETDNVKSAYMNFGKDYLVEFISQSKLKWYLNRLQSEIERINTEYWKLPEVMEK